MDAGTDEDLVRMVRAADMDAFDVLYARYEHRLFGYVLRLVGDRGLAEDLFQDVFFGVLQDQTFDPAKGRFSAWLFTVARNRCLMEHRRVRRSEARHQESQGLRAGDRELEPVDEVVDRNARVRAAMDRLPEPQRQVLLLKQVGELTYREIAAMLDIAEGTAKSRVHAATRAFRQQLESGLGDHG